VLRLTPPSDLFSYNDPNPPYIARFLPGQRFDLQATLAPDAGQLVVGVAFAVDNEVVPGTITLALGDRERPAAEHFHRDDPRLQQSSSRACTA
jgi:hypothetical protein